MAGLRSSEESLRTSIGLVTIPIEPTMKRAYSISTQTAGLVYANGDSQHMPLPIPASARRKRYLDPSQGLPHAPTPSVSAPWSGHFPARPENHSDHDLYLSNHGSSRRTRGLRQSTVRWLPEILSCILSLFCVIAIVVILAIYDGQLTPSWPLGITLNALLALLTSLAKLALLAPIMEGIGQLRWQWFSQRYRRLTDFDLFDQASRGAFGSLKLLVSLKGGMLGVLGAMLIVTSILTSPITQQTIQYPTRLAPTNSSASVSRVTVYDYAITFPGESGVDLSALNGNLTNFKRNILSGAYSPAGTALEDSPPTCGSGYCTFPDFVSLGVCSKVSDVSSHLSVKRVADRDWKLFGLDDNTTWTASLPLNPDTMTLTAPNLRSLDFFADLAGRSISFNETESTTSLLNVYLIYSNPPTEPSGHVSFGSVEIMFYWCAKAFSLNVTSTTAHWAELARSTVIKESNATSLNFFRNIRFSLCMLAIGKECNNLSWGRTILAPPPGFASHPDLVIGETTGIAIGAALLISFLTNPPSPGSPNAPAEGSGGMVLIGRGIYRVTGDMSLALGTQLWGSAPSGQPLDQSAQLEAVEYVFSNMAKGVENNMRQSAHSYAGNSASVNGTALSPTPYVKIQWPWLIFLMLELILSILFLAGTLLMTHAAGIQIIKGSSLGTLCSLDEPTRHHLGGIHDFEGVKQRARCVDVRLEKGVSGAGLWLASRT